MFALQHVSVLLFVLSVACVSVVCVFKGQYGIIETVQVFMVSWAYEIVRIT